MTATPAPDVTDRTDATDAEFAARIAAFEGAPYPLEVADARLEALAPQPADAEGIWLR